MLRTTAEELIVEDGKVTGVKATQYDGTPVTAHATKGVVIATGGYAANLQMVVDTNVYWSSDYLSTSTKTTNRSSLKGDGITMAQAAGADVTGMGYTQMMPISWIDDGNLAFGGGNYAIYLNPTTGKRFVDETSERDVLSGRVPQRHRAQRYQGRVHRDRQRRFQDPWPVPLRQRGRRVASVRAHRRSARRAVQLPRS